MNIPLDEQVYVNSLEEIIWGGTLLAITMGIHGFGMLWVLRVNGGLKQHFDRNPSFTKGMSILILGSWMILFVHLVEVVAWSGFFLWKDAIAVSVGRANHSICYYFALLDYTTLGSNYNLRVRWRLLEGMIATAGLLTFAWSTGVLLTIVQDFQEQQMQLIKKRREKRHPPTVRSGPAGSSASGSPSSSP